MFILPDILKEERSLRAMLMVEGKVKPPIHVRSAVLGLL